MGGVTECIFGLDCLETKQRGIVMICHNLGLVRNVRLEVASSWYRMLVVLMGLMNFDEDPMIRLRICEKITTAEIKAAIYLGDTSAQHRVEVT